MRCSFYVTKRTSSTAVVHQGQGVIFTGCRFGRRSAIFVACRCSMEYLYSPVNHITGGYALDHS
jgi:hypothetical protein